MILWAAQYWETDTQRKTQYFLNQTNTLFFFIMSREVALGMLRVGNTGDEILQILDVIVADIESEKTVNEIADILF